ncbi:hypothetical protein OMDBNIEC_00063 [Salmonella phage STP-SP5]|nr:hypothetical protein OMDBNIEC_00063 [Salmonella phage STP-SP5]
METPLATQMIERADRDGLAEDHAMRRTAIALDEFTVKYAKGQCTVQKFVGAWARARRCWSNYTGEPLL